MSSRCRHTGWPVVLLIALSLTAWGHFQDASGQSLSQSARRPLPNLGRSAEDLQQSYQLTLEIQAVVDRHQDDLKQIPGVYAVTTGADRVIVHAIVHTDERGNKPATLPPALQAVPTILEGVPVEIEPLYLLPPPAGVVVLQPFPSDPQTQACPPQSVPAWNTGHVECFALAESCPEGFEETIENDWRFCLNPNIFSPIPNVMIPPIAEIPYAQAEAIRERHSMELMQLPGVRSVGVGAEGIVVGTNHPEALPASIEGLPVIAEPVRPLKGSDWP